MEMIEKNIFRPLPNKKKATNIGMSETGVEQEEQVDPSWPHLQGVYELFLQLILNDATDVKSMKVFITPQFIQGVRMPRIARVVPGAVRLGGELRARLPQEHPS